MGPTARAWTRCGELARAHSTQPARAPLTPDPRAPQSVESEEDDPQLLLSIPFTCPVKIRSLTVIGGGDGMAPRTLKAYVNHETLDFSDAEARPAVQEWTLQEDYLGVIEYPTQFSRFQNVSRLWLLIDDNHGADHTLISYIGLSGVGSEHKRRAVQTVYEARATGNFIDPLKEPGKGGTAEPGM